MRVFIQVLIVFITEMISRGALEAALSKVDVQQMTWLINFIGRHIRSPRMSLPLTHLCQKVLDLYPAEAPENVGGFITLLNSFCELRNIMIQEIRLQDELLILKGLMLGIGM